MSGRGSSSRHRARELALQTLYAIDLGLRRGTRGDLSLHSVTLDASPSEVEETLAKAERDDPPADSPQAAALPVVAEEDARAVFDGIAANFEAPPGACALAWELVSEVCDRGAALDERIAGRARNWRISRMAVVDRNVLRLGTYELAYTTTPAPVVMDEAVELARRYGSDASPAFVNGILDALATDLRPDDGSAPAASGNSTRDSARGDAS